MKFSESEGRHIAKLRKQQERWRIFRWLFIVGGLGGVVCAFLVVREVGRNFVQIATSHQPLTAIDLMLGSYLTYAMLLSYLLGTCGVLMVSWAIIRWKGNPTIAVLIALVDRAEAAGAAGSEGGV